MIDADIIRRIPRFADITAQAQAMLCRHAAVRAYESGAPIFFEGDSCGHLYIVLEGEVRIAKLLESGREVIVDFIWPGESFGEVALMDGDGFPANATAKRPTRVLLLPRDVYLQMLKQCPEVARSIIRDLLLRMRALSGRVEVLSEAGVRSRIAHLLLAYSRNIGEEVAGGCMLPILLSRNEIAAMVGARVETVIRIMSQWHKDDIMHTVERGFLISDAAGLAAIVADED